ncbi:hypothetical protein D2962_09540 [Biomaibacter acetigenes]|uniref:Uncharacterized protein n=1 Tax=Biomaibacter acetigenes TaxID=2316383 RepID=A0A3G2R5W4_9FIRM|nr:hypothetical protein [Biomaibacter acetigenes]AYO30822.1 hypothetical protein D2962_09540 [Biomaibacter acetigenes]
MAEVIQCPGCLQWLNLELGEARVLRSINSDEILYKCKKCGAYFDEDGVWEIVSFKGAGR